MDIAVSIIIPIYNAEKFMRKGLDSCVNQTMQNIEIICVNDASTDGSGEIIEEYVQKYTGKVISLNLEKNNGQGGARNQGIEIARGEYLCFMDSDDYLDIHLCEEVYKEAQMNEADVIFYDYIRVEDEKEYPVELIGQDEMDLWYSHPGCAVWLQMIRREIIINNDLFFPLNIRAADDAITPLWKYYAKRRYKLCKPYYYYVNRSDSLVNEVKISSVITPITGVIPYRYRLMQQKGLVDCCKAESDLLIAKDISMTLIRFLKLGYCLTMDIITGMREKLDFSNGYVLDEKLIKYTISCAELEMVKLFLSRPEELAERYKNYSSFLEIQIERGLDSSVEQKIRNDITSLQQKYGFNVAIWGIGDKGIPIISTLIRMGYECEIFDNAKCGQKIWKNSNKTIHSFGDLKEGNYNIILVTSDVYYKAIEMQIVREYPRMKVVNFARMIRCGGGNQDWNDRERII